MLISNCFGTHSLDPKNSFGIVAPGAIDEAVWCGRELQADDCRSGGVEGLDAIAKAGISQRSDTSSPACCAASAPPRPVTAPA